MKKTTNKMLARVAIAIQDAKVKLNETKGQFVIDNGVVFVIIIVIGGIAIAVLTSYIENDFNSLITQQINSFFD